MQALHLEKPAFFSADFLENKIWELARKNNFQDTFRIKINVWRESTGWYAPEQNQISWLLRLFPHTEKPLIKQKAIFFNKVPLVASQISPYKTCNALPYVLAGIEKNNCNADEVILLDCYQHIADALVSNIFWIRDNCLYTPMLACGGKKGVMREQVLEFCKQENIHVQEGCFGKEDILKAETIFTTNVAGIEVIARLENKTFSTAHLLIENLRNLLEP
ncbi:MAG: aminotransferase class IV, partial [Raineya sp.]|nr:aminotransferase class IV [Raineya sp.]